MSQDTLLKIVGGLVAWLIVSGLLTLGFSRWLRYQRAHDQLDGIVRWRHAERERWKLYEPIARRPHG